MKIENCPHCGNDQEYFTKDYVQGTIRSFSRFDGGEADNYEMYDHLSHKMGKSVYCAECKKKIANLKDMEG